MPTDIENRAELKRLLLQLMQESGTITLHEAVGADPQTGKDIKQRIVDLRLRAHALIDSATWNKET